MARRYRKHSLRNTEPRQPQSASVEPEQLPSLLRAAWLAYLAGVRRDARVIERRSRELVARLAGQLQRSGTEGAALARRGNAYGRQRLAQLELRSRATQLNERARSGLVVLRGRTADLDARLGERARRIWAQLGARRRSASASMGERVSAWKADAAPPVATARQLSTDAARRAGSGASRSAANPERRSASGAAALVERPRTGIAAWASAQWRSLCDAFFAFRARQAYVWEASGGGSAGGRRFGLPHLFAGLGGLIAAAVIMSVLFTVALFAALSADYVSPAEMSVNRPAGGATILDRNGEVLYRYFDERAGLRQPVPLDAVSDHLLAATIATEDATFYSNPGVNFRGLARAAVENLTPFSGGFFEGTGGSSITQQLVKRVYFDAQQQTVRSIERKAREVVYAIRINQENDKEQVLAWYVNEISYGGLYNGIEAASQGYFGKPASELTLAEAALLAGIPQSPARFDPRLNPEGALERRNQVLQLLQGHESLRIREGEEYVVSQQAIEAAMSEPLELAPPQPFEMNAPHFVFTHLQPELEALFGREGLYEDGLVITTTLDLRVQREAERILEQYIAEYEEQSGSHNGAAMVLDAWTGEILAMVGSRDYHREDIEGRNNNLLALNSPGSAFKPFVFLAGFEKLGFGPGFPVEDRRISHVQPDGSVFEPANPDNRFRGWISMRQALGNSLNIPAFTVADAVGIHEVVEVGRRAGLTTLDGSYGPAIALGGVDLRAFDLAYAYSVLSSGGVMRGQESAVPRGQAGRPVDPISILNVTTNDGQIVFSVDSRRAEQRLFAEEHVFLVNNILTDPQAQCQVFGCGGLTVPGYNVAVKTGTSAPFDPNGPHAGLIGETWSFGYTPDVVVAVWAGNSDNAPVRGISSTTIAFQAMRDILLAYYAGGPATDFMVPDGVVHTRACFTGVVSACTTDYFLREQLQRSGPVSATGPQAYVPQPEPTPTPRNNPRQEQQNQPRPTPTPQPQQRSQPRPTPTAQPQQRSQPERNLQESVDEAIRELLRDLDERGRNGRDIVPGRGRN